MSQQGSRRRHPGEDRGSAEEGEWRGRGTCPSKEDVAPTLEPQGTHSTVLEEVPSLVELQEHEDEHCSLPCLWVFILGSGPHVSQANLKLAMEPRITLNF